VCVSLFVDPEPKQIAAAAKMSAPVIEIHTGHYANAANEAERSKQLARIRAAVQQGLDLGLQVNAGHGLNYHNVQTIASIPGVAELNIGHAIIARALFPGMRKAVADMKRLMREASAT
jgi:pyridoxine 5-phosphate synthase